MFLISESSVDEEGGGVWVEERVEQAGVAIVRQACWFGEVLRCRFIRCQCLSVFTGIFFFFFFFFFFKSATAIYFG